MNGYGNSIGQRVDLVFTPEQLERCRQLQRDLHDLLPQFDRLEACGKECQDRRQLAGFLLQTLQRVEAEFGPKGGT